MKPEVRKYLEDVRASIVEIDEFVDTSKGFSGYMADRPGQLDLPQGLRLGTLRLADASGSAARGPDGDNYNILIRSLPILKEEVVRLLADGKAL